MPFDKTWNCIFTPTLSWRKTVRHSVVLFQPPVKEEKNSEFKPDLRRKKIDIVSYSAHDGGVGEIHNATLFLWLYLFWDIPLISSRMLNYLFGSNKSIYTFLTQTASRKRTQWPGKRYSNWSWSLCLVAENLLYTLLKFNKNISFLCLMTYQPLLVIKSQSNLCGKTVLVAFGPYLRVIKRFMPFLRILFRQIRLLKIHKRMISGKKSNFVSCVNQWYVCLSV